MELPEDVRAGDLDRDVRAELRGLAPLTADKVARHLVVAGRAMDDDPELALQHARAATALAGRVAVVREANGLAAYAAGEYGDALAELRAARRMTGSSAHLALMADSERGLGRPERALDLVQEGARVVLPADVAVELAIVGSGARRDLGQFAAAVVTLQGAALDDAAVHPWTPRLWYAYAAALADAGRPEEALRWFASAAAVDEAEETDAAERAAALELAAAGLPASPTSEDGGEDQSG